MTQTAPRVAKGKATRTEEALRAFHEESAFGKAYDTRLALRLWPFMRPYQGLLWLSIGIGVVVACMSLSRTRTFTMATRL